MSGPIHGLLLLLTGGRISTAQAQVLLLELLTRPIGREVSSATSALSFAVAAGS